MSIRLRLTLIYSTILALTLIIFGAALYIIQARDTLDALKSDLRRSGENISTAVLWRHLRPDELRPEPARPPPVPFETFSDDPAFQRLREREIVRVLGADGKLIASPFGSQVDALPLSNAGLQALRGGNEWWELVSTQSGRLLIYNRPVIADEGVISIVQVARPLTEHDRSLGVLGSTLLIAGVVTTLIAFGIGWALAGVTLRPIHRITQTAQAIGNESGTNELTLARRVDYHGPNDEIGQLAKTFNTMLARLQEAYQRLSQALSMQRNFVADVSHEMRTPLTTVRGNLELLRRQPPLPAEEQSDVLSDLVEESDRLIRLVNDLLVLARADVGLNLRKEPVLIRPTAEEVCRQVYQLDPQRDISLDVPSELALSGDRDAFKQVLLILVDNALKHTAGAISIGARLNESQVMVQVQDAGPGLAPEKLEHIFDRFYRGEADPNVPGFGLGLAIAKALVEGQGGKISIESQPGSGSKVSLQFPAAPTAPGDGTTYPS